MYDLASLTLDSNPGDMAVDANVATETGGLGFGEGQTLQWTDTITWTGGGMRAGSSVKSSNGIAGLRIVGARHFASAGHLSEAAMGFARPGLRQRAREPMNQGFAGPFLNPYVF